MQNAVNNITCSNKIVGIKNYKRYRLLRKFYLDKKYPPRRERAALDFNAIVTFKKRCERDRNRKVSMRNLLQHIIVINCLIRITLATVPFQRIQNTQIDDRLHSEFINNVNRSIIISENISSSNDGGRNGNRSLETSVNTTEANIDCNETLGNIIKTRRMLEAASMPGEDDDYFDDDNDGLDDYDILISNKSAKGAYIGAPCDISCSPKLHHVYCDAGSFTCGCERKYPVIIGRTKGCAKPKKLGEQCYYHQTCMYSDANSLCVQVSHNALCQCVDGYHSVSYTKPTKRVFCTQDVATLTSDLPTLLGVTTGIAILAGLICMVLHLFSKTKYPRHRNFADANLPPPIMYSSDTEPTTLPGIPLTVQSGRPSSRSSIRSSGSIGSYGNRRPSSAPQTGSRRPSLASIHSTSSSIRSYSMMRFEKETQQKELRQEMRLRLAKLQQQQHLNQTKPIIVGEARLHAATIAKVLILTPSPLSPNSTDELLPVVDETQEILSPKLMTQNEDAFAAYKGPCSSSSEGL